MNVGSARRAGRHRSSPTSSPTGSACPEARIAEQFCNRICAHCRSSAGALRGAHEDRSLIWRDASVGTVLSEAPCQTGPAPVSRGLRRDGRHPPRRTRRRYSFRLEFVTHENTDHEIAQRRRACSSNTRFVGTSRRVSGIDEAGGDGREQRSEVCRRKDDLITPLVALEGLGGDLIHRNAFES